MTYLEHPPSSAMSPRPSAFACRNTVANEEAVALRLEVTSSAWKKTTSSTTQNTSTLASTKLVLKAMRIYIYICLKIGALVKVWLVFKHYSKRGLLF